MNIQQAYDDVKKFNSIAGNLTKYGVQGINHKKIDDQIEFIYEELAETSEASLYGNSVELLDGACDLFVTVAGLLQKLEVNGFNVQEALKRVNDNNLSKFPKIAEYEANPEICPPNGEPQIAEDDRVVFKREYDGKVMKPTNFVAVDIADCVPEGFFGVAEEF